MGRWASVGGIGFMRLIAPLPLSWIRGLGWLLGNILYVVVIPRRRVAITNLSLCFSELSKQEIRGLARQTFIYFAQAWFDRSWLWHGRPQQLAARLSLTGLAHELAESPANTVLFAPHFYGLDAGWTALTCGPTAVAQRRFTTIYTRQEGKPELDAWILQGRNRGQVRLFTRADGVREIAQSLKSGEWLYLLPDMDFGANNTLFVPFFGVQAATTPSLGRFAKLGQAQVRSVFTRITPAGYEIEISAPWAQFPSSDLSHDTARMNQELQALIKQAPAQYYWVHKRFKTRPPGEPSIY